MEQSKAESIASRLKAAWNAYDVKEFEDLSPVLVAVHSDENESHFGALWRLINPVSSAPHIMKGTE